MGIMDQMMDRMVHNMSVPEKEAMMSKMMPLMMKDLDVMKMMPGMMSGIGRLLNVTAVVTFIRQITKDEELNPQLGQLVKNLPKLSRKMRYMMAEMRPAMSIMMSGMMDLMADRVMPVMMPVMSEIMPVMMKEKMPELMARNETVMEFVPKMMTEIIPHCVRTFSPMMEPKDQRAFLARVTDSIAMVEVSDGPEEKRQAEIVN